MCEFVGFKGFEFGFYVFNVHISDVFHGRVGPRRKCRLCSDIVVVVYVYIYMTHDCAANSVLQVWLSVLCCVLFCMCCCSFLLTMNLT